MITIYKSDGTIRTTQHESPDSYFNPKISDEENAQINFEIGEYINFEVGDYILLYGFYLTLYSIPTPLKKSSNNRYSYQLKFESPRYGMSKVNLLLFDNTTSLQTPAYNTLATYSKGNVVKYHTLYWECVSDSHVTGISPEEGQYWQLKSNVTHEVPEYNPATTYTSGDEVTYNLCIWKHIGAVNTVGVHPEEGDSWTQITTAPDFDFSAVLTPRRWAQLFCDNMNRARPKENWSVGYTISDQPKEQAFTNASVLDALGGTAELYNTEFWIGQLSHNNYTINIGKKSNPTSLVMKYGGGNGFKNIERDEVTENNKITRLVALGGTSNIPSTYRGGSKRLMLPNSYYLDADNIDLNNPLEGTMTWDDIYPCMLHATDDWNASTAYAVGEMVVYNNISWTCLVGNKNQTPSEGTYWQISEGTVTTAVSQYKLIDKNLTFNPLDPNLIMHDGTVPKVHFITGNLAGYEFPIAGYNKDTKQITIQQIQDANDSYLPTAGYTFSENDQFNIVDFYMPNEYISKAENLLKAKATEWLNQYSKDQVSYKGEVDTVWATDGKVELNCGDVIEVIDTDFGIDLPYRITDLKRYITEPYKYEIVLDDTPYVPTKLSSMKNEIVKNSTYIQYNNLDTQMAKTRTYKGAAEAINMAFDPGSKYFTDGIAPLFVKTAMALFGTETQQYNLTGVSVATYLNTPNVISWTAGVIIDNTQQDTARSWNISAGLFTATDANTSYYAYIRCNKTTSSSEATILFTETQYRAIGDDNYYYFLLGTLTKLTNSVRQFYTSNGFTFISGNNIVTGKVQSQDGISYIDLDNNEGHLGTPSKYVSWDENGVKMNEPLVVSPSGVTSPIACFRGAYTTNTYYYKGDSVTYDGSTWQFINATSAQNITPVEGGNWTCISAKGATGATGATGNYYEHRYAVNGSSTDAPSLINTDTSPSGWTTTLPTQNLYQFTWMITSEKTSGGALVGTWSTPVRVTGIQGPTGATGAQGNPGPAMSFYGTWSASSTYIGNSNIVSVVIYNSTYYIARYDVGGPFSSSTTPNNDTSHWNSLGASFSSIATGLLLAQEAYIDNLYVSKLSTSTNPYKFLLSILDSSLGIFRNKADSNDISKAMIALGKDISNMQEAGERKPAMKVEDTQWKGDYNANTIYYKDDRVYYSYGNGNTYIFTHEWLETETPVAGILPTNSTYWQYLGSGNLGGGKYTEIGCEGIFSNGSNIQVIIGTFSILSNFSEAMLLQKRNSDPNGVSAAVYGEDQTSDSDNINASKSYGGMFNRLFIQSELDNITTTSSTDDLTLSKKSNHTIHYYGSGTKRIYLPTVNYRDVGLKFVICNLNENGTLLINYNGTNSINIGNWTAGQKWKATCVYDGTYWVITYVHD